jgi:hypothetical protein
MLLISIVLATAVCGGAQWTADFSGNWVHNEALLQTTHKVDPAAKAMGLKSPPITITQSPETLTIQHDPPMPGWKAQRYVYNLAGKKSVNYNGANILTTTSRWDGKKLVNEGTSYSETSQGESTWKWRETIWLDARGRLLVETRTTDESGKTHVVTQTYDRK